MHSAVVIEQNTGIEQALRFDQRLDLPHDPIGFLAPFRLDIGCNRASGPMLGLERALVLAGDEFRQGIVELAEALFGARLVEIGVHLKVQVSRQRMTENDRPLETMRIELRHDPDQSGPAFKAYTQPASSESPYRSVELRMPAGVGSNDQLLIVHLAGDSDVSRKDIIDRYGNEFETEVPSPEERDLPAYLRYQRPGGYLSLGINDDARLVSFVISRSAQ